MKRLGMSALVVARLALAAALAVLVLGHAARAASSDERWRTVMRDDFSRAEELTETTAPERSSNRVWWLESGAGMTSGGGVASTWAGEAPRGYLRSRYALRDPVDTDGGRHPQSLFRLLSRRVWHGDVRSQAYFSVAEYHLSASPQRYDPNGLLLFSRYADADNLYYAGVRVDGHAIVKKKSAGVYYTLAETPLYPGSYDRETNPILLPRSRWIGLRSVTRDNPDGSVTVSLYVDEGRTGRWQLALEGVDAGVGGAPFLREGRTGIRTDFMDVRFDDYAVALPQ